MTESYLWRKLKQASDADMTRHEDKLNLGIPDVSYGLEGRNGWIELKYLKSWPKSPQKHVPFRNLKVHQVRFLGRRGQAGGACFLLVLVGKKDVVLIDWEIVHRLGKMTKSQIQRRCSGWYSLDTLKDIDEVLREGL